MEISDGTGACSVMTLPDRVKSASGCTNQSMSSRGLYFTSYITDALIPSRVWRGTLAGTFPCNCPEIASRNSPYTSSAFPLLKDDHDQVGLAANPLLLLCLTSLHVDIVWQ